MNYLVSVTPPTLMSSGAPFGVERMMTGHLSLIRWARRSRPLHLEDKTTHYPPALSLKIADHASLQISLLKPEGNFRDSKKSLYFGHRVSPIQSAFLVDIGGGWKHLIAEL